ncbi:MAG: hypothetical protein M0001_11230 [Treponema sp.]|nr:hypothetical protein [Treponema sp.]
MFIALPHLLDMHYMGCSIEIEEDTEAPDAKTVLAILVDEALDIRAAWEFPQGLNSRADRFLVGGF